MCYRYAGKPCGAARIGLARQRHFAERELIGIFRRPDSVGVVWRQFLAKAEGEFVNHAVFVEKDGRVLIDHCLIC